MFVSDQEKGILLDMRNYREQFVSRDRNEQISTIQLCAAAAVHNVSFDGPEPTEIQVTMDIEYEDESYLRDQTLNYIFDSRKRGTISTFLLLNIDIPHVFPDEVIGQPTSEWQRKCIIVEGIRPIRYILLVLVAKNHPTIVTKQFKGDVFRHPKSSFAAFKDISIRPLFTVTPEDEKHSLLSQDVPARVDTYSTEEFFVKAEYTPVSAFFTQL